MTTCLICHTVASCACVLATPPEWQGWDPESDAGRVVAGQGGADGPVSCGWPGVLKDWQESGYLPADMLFPPIAQET